MKKTYQIWMDEEAEDELIIFLVEGGYSSKRKNDGKKPHTITITEGHGRKSK